MKPNIRRFQKKDAGEVSSLIVSTIFTVNIKDYTHGHLETIAARYTPEKLEENAMAKIVFVAESDGKIVGTATIQEDYISCVFVLPEYIGKGVGRLLMTIVEQEAIAKKFQKVRIVSSLTAHIFYKRLGYQDDIVGELGIDMHKDLI